MIRSRRLSFRLGFCLIALGCSASENADAGERFFRRRVVAPAPTPTTRVRVVQPERDLGTFGPTPYLFVKGNSPNGNGYSPMGQYGDVSMDIYGPLSSYRDIAAPVVTYSRGYDGVYTRSIGTGFSSPNRPTLSPVVYPTQANNYYGFPDSGSPPWWAVGGSSIDEN